jgi:hypothetical protein
MSPALPGSLPTWMTPSRIVFVAQCVSLLLLVGLLAHALSLTLTTSALLFVASALLFFMLSLLTANQCTWLSVAAAYGEAGAWVGSLASLVFFLYVFCVGTSATGVNAVLFALSCSLLLGWLPGLLAGFGVSLVFWCTGGWLFASLQHQREFPALDDAHRMLSRVGLWFLFLSGASAYGGFFLGALLFLWLGAAGALFANQALRQRRLWLERVESRLEPRWRLSAISMTESTLLPLSNYSQQNAVLCYRHAADAPYRSTEDEVPIALC